MPFSGGDSFPAVVGEVGSYATKMGFAGEDYPRAYFRSTTAVFRQRSTKLNGDKRNNKDRKTTKMKRSYDFLTMKLENDGGAWEVANPVDKTTGLIYQRMVYETPGSMNSNKSESDNESEKIPKIDRDIASSPLTSVPGDCYTHFSDYLAHGYESSLCTESSSTPLLLVERSYNPPPIRQKIMEIVFEEHNAPATFFARDAVCACYAVGRTTGTVVDIGYSGTVVTPVFDGFVETKGILRSPVGASMMDDIILSHMDGLYKTKKARMKLDSPVDYVMPLYQVQSREKSARKDPFHSLARLDVARLSREDGSSAGVAAFGYASIHDLEGEAAQQEPSDIYQQYATAPKATFKLPDGTEIDISQTKRFDVSEIMFGKGGRNALSRETAVIDAKKQLDAMITSIGMNVKDEDVESNAITQMEESRKRKKHAKLGGKKKQYSSQASHEKIMKACTPYLSSTIGEFTSATIPTMICDSAFKCDRDQQAQLLGNAIVCGGGACLSTSVLSSSRGDNSNSMPERIREECEAIIHSHTPGWRVKVLSPGITERSICSWLGASILGSLGSFHDMWVTKAEYEDHGAAIVNRKFP